MWFNELENFASNSEGLALLKFGDDMCSMGFLGSILCKNGNSRITTEAAEGKLGRCWQFGRCRCDTGGGDGGGPRCEDNHPALPLMFTFATK